MHIVRSLLPRPVTAATSYAAARDREVAVAVDQLRTLSLRTRERSQARNPPHPWMNDDEYLETPPFRLTVVGDRRPRNGSMASRGWPKPSWAEQSTRGADASRMPDRSGGRSTSHIVRRSRLERHRSAPLAAGAILWTMLARTKPSPRLSYALARRARIPCREFAGLDVPWARGLPAIALRELMGYVVLGPLMDRYTCRHVVGREHLSGLNAPVVFVANHLSHLDTPAIQRALPGRWRRRTAVAAAADYFYRDRAVAHVASVLFNTVPLQRSAHGRSAPTSHLDNMLDQAWSVLVFAEGTRSRGGHLGALRPGAARLAVDHGIPLVPVHVSGTNEALPVGSRWFTPKAGGTRGGARHIIEISFGTPIHAGGGECVDDVMCRLSRFLESGAADEAGQPPSPRSAGL